MVEREKVVQGEWCDVRLVHHLRSAALGPKFGVYGKREWFIADMAGEPRRSPTVMFVFISLRVCVCVCGCIMV